MTSDRLSTIRDNYQLVLSRIERAAASVGRKTGEVRVVVVTKGHSLDVTRAAMQLGSQALGENYVEDAVPKIEILGKGDGVAWHMIGHIQSRKANTVCEYFDYVHSLDRMKIADRLNRYWTNSGRKLPVLLECNVSGEESKYGWKAWDERAHWPALAEKVPDLLAYPNLSIKGLMTMAPYLSDPDLARPYFERLRRLRDYLANNFPQIDWQELSMGMSADYEAAVQEGATMVRIGTAILGERPD